VLSISATVLKCSSKVLHARKACINNSNLPDMCIREDKLSWNRTDRKEHDCCNQQNCGVDTGRRCCLRSER